MKNIVIFIDGTGQTPENNTNVYQLYRAAGGIVNENDNNHQNTFDDFFQIDGQSYASTIPEVSNNNQVEQRLLYLSGIGTSHDRTVENILNTTDFLPLRTMLPITTRMIKLSNQAITTSYKITGETIEYKLKQAYSFIVSNYDAGDNILLFGFSRGAFCVRSLVEMIDKVGILRGTNQAPLSPDQRNIFRTLWSSERNQDTTAIARLIEKAYAFYCDKSDTAELARFRTRTHQAPTISFLGLWDTVGSIGDGQKHNKFDEKYLPTAHLPVIVKRARHALAIDEQRITFKPTIWTVADNVDSQQKWFAGAHSDIGGGYDSDDGSRDDESKKYADPASMLNIKRYSALLSESALSWMAEEASTGGLRLMDTSVLLPKGLKHLIRQDGTGDFTNEEKELVTQENYVSNPILQSKARKKAQEIGRQHDPKYPAQNIRELIFNTGEYMENSLSSLLKTKPRIVGKLSSNLHHGIENRRPFDEQLAEGVNTRLGKPIGVENRTITYAPLALKEYQQYLMRRANVPAVVPEISQNSERDSHSNQQLTDSVTDNRENNNNNSRFSSNEEMMQEVTLEDKEQSLSNRQRILDCCGKYLKENSGSTRELHVTGLRQIETLQHIVSEDEDISDEALSILVNNVVDGPERFRIFQDVLSLLPKLSLRDEITLACDQYLAAYSSSNPFSFHQNGIRAISQLKGQLSRTSDADLETLIQSALGDGVERNKYFKEILPKVQSFTTNANSIGFVS